MTPWSVRKTSLDYKIGKRQEKTYFKGADKGILYQVSKINTLRKGRAGAQSQGEICPKFSQAEEHGKFPLVSRD